jgi:hypothetical protein
MAFADVGKAWKDISGGYVYDQKASFATKTSFGATLNGSTSYKSDGTLPAELKTTYKLAPTSTLEATLTHQGKVTASLSKDNLAPGLKATLSSTLLGASPDAKVSLAYSLAKPPVIGGKLGLKSDIALIGGSKINASAGWAQGALAAGAEVEYDTSKGTVSKYAAGAQTTLSNGGVAAALLADKDTVKLSYVHKCSPTVTGGVEVVHKLSKGVTSGTAAAVKKLQGGAAAKASLTSAGLLSVLYTADVQPKTTASVAMQVNTLQLDKPPKMGVQLNFKA